MKSYAQVILTLICIVLSVNFTSAQKKNYHLERKNSINFTNAGLGLLMSVNYGRVLDRQPNYFIEVTGGLGKTFRNKGFSLPVQGTFNLGPKNNFIVAGLGTTYWRGTKKETTSKVGSFYVAPILGFRKFFYNHYFMRVHFSPLLRVAGTQFNESKRFSPHFGATFGYTFNSIL